MGDWNKFLPHLPLNADKTIFLKRKSNYVIPCLQLVNGFPSHSGFSCLIMLVTRRLPFYFFRLNSQKSVASTPELTSPRGGEKLHCLKILGCFLSLLVQLCKNILFFSLLIKFNSAFKVNPLIASLKISLSHLCRQSL